MALTAANIQTQVGAATGVKSTQTALYAEILYYIQHALDELYAMKFSWARVQDQFTTTAVYETGTISGTSGSTTVTGSGTSWSPTWVDTFMDVNNKMHRVSSYGTGGTSATLVSALDATVAASTSYGIYYPWVTLDATLAELTSVMAYPHAPLRINTIGDLDDLFMFTQKQDYATHCALVTPDTSYSSRIALYPFPTEARMYTYSGWRMAPTLSASTELGIPLDYRGLITHMTLARWWTFKDKRGDLAGYHENQASKLLGVFKPRDTQERGPRVIRGWRVRDTKIGVPYSDYDLWT